MKLTGEGCLKYYDDLNFNLYPYQRYMIKAWFEGKKVATARGLGRTYCLKLVKDYIDKVLQEWEEERPEDPDITFDYTHGVAVGLLDEELVKSDNVAFHSEYLGRR